MKKIKFASVMSIVLAAVMLISLLPACGASRLYSEGEGELNIVATNFPPFEFARVVAGEKATITILQDNGADLHNYSPTTATLTALSNADIFICVGGDSDAKWIDDAIANAQNPDLKVVKLTDCVEVFYGELESHNHSEYCHSTHGDHDEEEHDHEHEHEDEHEHEHEDGHVHTGDEHVWTSIKNVIKIVDAIAEACKSKDAENADFYAANAAAYTAELKALDAEYQAAVDASAHKTLVFADRFPFVYMIKDYGLCHYAAFSGCSTDVNASFETQTKLAEAVKHNSLPAVIIIESSDGSLAETVVAGTDAKILTMNSMQAVTRAQITDGRTYLETMKSNLNVLKEALN